MGFIVVRYGFHRGEIGGVSVVGERSVGVVGEKWWVRWGVSLYNFTMSGYVNKNKCLQQSFQVYQQLILI